MVLKNKNKKRKKLYDVLTDPTIVIRSGLIGIFTYIATLIISMIIASIVNSDFNIGIYSISSLGGIASNVAPWLIDLGFIVMAIGLIPAICYLDQKLAPYPNSTDKIQDYSRARSRLGSYGTLFMVLGVIFMGLVGVFSVDNDPKLFINYFYPVGEGVGMHLIVSWIAMASITMGGIFFGVIIALYDTMFPKVMGYYMIFVPIIPFVSLWYVQPRFVLYEWFLQLSFLGWLIPGGLITINHIRNERVK